MYRIPGVGQWLSMWKTRKKESWQFANAFQHQGATMPFVGCSALFFPKCSIGVMLMDLRFEWKKSMPRAKEMALGKNRSLWWLEWGPQNRQTRGWFQDTEHTEKGVIPTGSGRQRRIAWAHSSKNKRDPASKKSRGGGRGTSIDYQKLSSDRLRAPWYTYHSHTPTRPPTHINT